MLAFGVTLLLARTSVHGHRKHTIRPLAAPQRFVDVVHRDLLQAGLLAPAEAPPQVATSTS